MKRAHAVKMDFCYPFRVQTKSKAQDRSTITILPAALFLKCVGTWCTLVVMRNLTTHLLHTASCSWLQLAGQLPLFEPRPLQPCLHNFCTKCKANQPPSS